MKNGEIDLIVNTPLGADPYFDEKAMRTAATQRGVPLVTTLSGGQAMVQCHRGSCAETLRRANATGDLRGRRRR